MREFKTASLADQVFERLENDIILGVYEKGEILTELKLVEQLGVSRTPIREALRRLEQERLIVDSGKGSRVVGITAEDALDIMEIRQYLEGLAAYHAALNITDEGKEQLLHLLDLQEFYYAKQDVEHLRQIDDEFHELICNLSQRNIVKDTLLPLHRKTRRYRKLSLEDSERNKLSLQEHRQICNAIINGEAQQAMDLSSEHVENAKNNMIRRVK
ncbi:MAG: GntR family transcriptional regulator [Oscillospiraceae bacterium]|nr:GntR family transcriptional regulator [Oscillospiraceae bacterium]